MAVVVRRRRGLGRILLLDDVLSELDREVGGRVLAWLDGQGQVVYTATDAQPAATGAGAVWQLSEGRLEPQGTLTRGAA